MEPLFYINTQKTVNHIPSGRQNLLKRTPLLTRNLLGNEAVGTGANFRLVPGWALDSLPQSQLPNWTQHDSAVKSLFERKGVNMHVAAGGLWGGAHT